jgi:hypothetical protein
MNGWDLFTWAAAVLLAGSAVTIFAFFLKDARKIFQGKRPDRSDDE